MLAVWNGGFLQWNGDPMGRDAKDWVSVLEYGKSAWSNPDAVGCDIRYCCHDPIWIKNKKGEITLLFAKFLDTEVNFTTWCNGRDELWMRKTPDGGRTWLPAHPANITSGHASNDSVLLPDGTIVFASTSSELVDKYFGAIRIYISHDDGETFETGRSSMPRTEPDPRTSALPAPERSHPPLFAHLPGNVAGDRRATIPASSPANAAMVRSWTKPVPSGILNNDPSRRDQLGTRNHPDGVYDTPETAGTSAPADARHEPRQGKTWTNIMELAPRPQQIQPAMSKEKTGG